MQTNMGNIWVLGIDPGKETGLAIRNVVTGDIEKLWTSNFWEAFHYTLNNALCWRGVVVEVPDNKNVFHKPAGGLKQVQRTAVNVGSVLREAELMAIGLERANIPVMRVNPRGKIDAGKFNQLTGWKHASNPHTRDAGMLTYMWRDGA